MGRSWRRRGRLRSEWRRTAHTGHWRHAPLTGGAAPVVTAAGGELSDGVVVQAQLLGRVLGLRLLRVDGTVLLAPARAGREASAPTNGRRPIAEGVPRDAGDATSARGATGRGATGRGATGRGTTDRGATGRVDGVFPAGRELAEAARLLEASDTVLRRSQPRIR